MSRALLLITCLLLPGCGAAGDFCREDKECPAGLVCSASRGKRGVCTYRVKAKEDSDPDGAPRDAGPDSAATGG